MRQADIHKGSRVRITKEYLKDFSPYERTNYAKARVGAVGTITRTGDYLNEFVPDDPAYLNTEITLDEGCILVGAWEVEEVK